MKATIITFCLIGAVFAYPISFNAPLDSTDSNSTESASVSQSSENSTSEQSSEQSTSIQSSESESVESTSEDTTSEESDSDSDSQSDESTGSDSMSETRDNSMSSEENVRKSWVQDFRDVMGDLSSEGNSTSSSTEVMGQGEQPSTQQPTHTSAIFTQEVGTTQLNQPLVDGATSSSESSESSEATAAPSASTSESSSSSESSESTEDSNSDSAEVQQLKATDSVNGTLSCESEEYIFNDIGDDAHHGVDNLMVPDDGERELTLRR